MCDRAFSNSSNAGIFLDPSYEFRNAYISFWAATDTWMYGPDDNTDLLTVNDQRTPGITDVDADICAKAQNQLPRFKTSKQEMGEFDLCLPSGNT